MSLQIIDTTTYIIGIQGKGCALKSKSLSAKLRSKKMQQVKNNANQIKRQKEPLEAITKNSNNSTKPTTESNLLGANHSECDQYEINSVNKKKRKIISSSGAVNNVQLIQKPYIKPKVIPKNAGMSPVPKKIQIIPNCSQINVQPNNFIEIPQASQEQNVQPTTINVSPMTVNAQREIHNNWTKTNINTLRQSKAKSCRGASKTVIEDVSLQSQNDGDDSNTAVQKHLLQSQQRHIGNSVHIIGQQPTSTQSMSPLFAKSNQKNNFPQEQLRSQHLASGNIRIASVPQQQLLFQQLNPNVTKSSVKADGQQQSNVQFTNVNVKKSLGDLNANQALPGPSSSSSAGGPVHIKHARLAMGKQKLEKLLPENYEHMRQSIMASLLKTNPEMFIGGQPVIGEITKNPSTSQTNNAAVQNPDTQSHSDV